MKLVIPPTIRMGALDINIVFNQRMLDATGDKGMSNSEDQKIRLDKNLTPSHKFVTLCHEIEHIAESLIGYTTNETVVSARAHMVAQAMLSLDIEPDFSQIPEEE